MKVQRTMFALVAMMFLFAGKSSAQQVKTDYDRSANFSHYKTYSWEHVKTQDPLYVDRIKNSVNAALTARGWTQVDSGGDVCIVANFLCERHLITGCHGNLRIRHGAA